VQVGLAQEEVGRILKLPDELGQSAL